MSKVQYPDIDELAEKIAKLVKAYQKSNDAVEKAEVFCTLKEIYSKAYSNLQESQTSYERLYNELNK